MQGLYGLRDSRSGKPLSSSIDPALVFNFLIIFLLSSQVEAGVQNLMWQRAQLFKCLEVVETMRAYIAHNMDNSEEL